MANDFWNFMSAGGANAASTLFNGLFGDSSDPYDEAMKQYKQYGQKSLDTQNPFFKAGTGAIPNYQSWLDKQKDPSGFINNLMNQYQESPWAKYQQQQSVRAGTNAASMGGLPNGMGGAGIGSTPFAQQLQQDAQNISSGDMNNWMSKALGINTQYGQGQENLINGGQTAANNMSNTYNNLGTNMGEASYGRTAGKNQDLMNKIAGIFGLAQTPGNMSNSGIGGSNGQNSIDMAKIAQLIAMLA